MRSTSARAVAGSLAALAVLAGCDHSRGGPAAAESHSAKPASVSPSLAGAPASGSARADVCDVYGFSVGQVNEAQSDFEKISKNGRKEYRWDEPMVPWNLLNMTTMFDMYSRRVAQRLVDGLTGNLPPDLAAWADKRSAWRSDVPEDLRRPLAKWVDAVDKWKALYKARASEKLDGAKDAYERARSGYTDEKGVRVDGANQKCGLE